MYPEAISGSGEGRDVLEPHFEKCHKATGKVNPLTLSDHFDERQSTIKTKANMEIAKQGSY